MRMNIIDICLRIPILQMYKTDMAHNKLFLIFRFMKQIQVYLSTYSLKIKDNSLNIIYLVLHMIFLKRRICFI